MGALGAFPISGRFYRSEFEWPVRGMAFSHSAMATDGPRIDISIAPVPKFSTAAIQKISGSLPRLWLRPPRHARPLPGMRGGTGESRGGEIVKHRLFTFFCIVSLALCLAVCVLWIRSYWFSETIAWQTIDGYRRLTTRRGSLELGLFLAPGTNKPADTFGPRYNSDIPTGPFDWINILDIDFPQNRIDWNHAGFSWHQVREGRNGYTHVAAFAPFWSIALLTGLLPLAWTAVRWRCRTLNRRHQAQDLCPNCGYDMRATPDRCPECGTVTKTPAAQ